MTTHDRIVELKQNGMSLTKIAREVQDDYPGLDLLQVVRRVRHALDMAGMVDKHEQTAPKAEALPPAPKPPKPVVVQNHEPSVTKSDWRGARTIRFGLTGDSHINSKYAQITHLHDYYDICAREGIAQIYHTGDMDEGEQMRQGHQYECYNQGADDHIAEIVRVYPKRTGIVTDFVTGNHDASIIKRCGCNIGPVIASRQKDMQYLGQDCAVIELTPNCALELRHPWDGSAYALSYKTQKMIDAMSGGEKPNILAVGHYHKGEYLFYRNVHCFQTGTFEAQTPFQRGKSLAAHMGGWIVEVDVEDDGTIRSVKQRFIPYYKAIKDDYKNWR